MNDPEAPSAFPEIPRAEPAIGANVSWIEPGAAIVEGDSDPLLLDRDVEGDRFLAVSGGVRGELRGEEEGRVLVHVDAEAFENSR